jgi:hypothetical protein
MKLTRRIDVFLFGFIFLNIAMPSHAEVLSGKGWGKTFIEAKKEALSDLSTTIQVQVESRFSTIESETDGKAVIDAKSVINLSSDLPILGADIKESEEENGIWVTAFLSAAKAGPLYTARLHEIEKKMANALTAAKKAVYKADQYQALVKSLPLFEQYSRHKFVAICLGIRSIPELPATKSDLNHRILALEKAADSIDFAAQLIIKEFDPALTHIYVYPPMMRKSHEVTPFAAVVRDCIVNKLHAVDSPDRADYLLTGRYEKTARGIDLAYTLYNPKGSAISGAVVRLSPDAFSDYDTEPKSITLDKLLHEGLAVSNDFHVTLTTNYGKENLLLLEGQEIEILVKSSRPAFFYLCGHIDKGVGQRHSYLLDLQEAEGARRFVRFINADDANKWISLGKFEVTPPFGVETLQMIAAASDPAENLPPARLDPATELYLIADAPEKGVTTTRAFKRKQMQKSTTTEAVLMATTMADKSRNAKGPKP